MKQLPKIEFHEAVKMLDTGYYLMHLNWLLGQRSEIYRENRDCSHFLVKAGQDWRNPNNPITLVIADAEAERKYMGSHAGTEKYGDQDRTYEELIIENQLLKKAIINEPDQYEVFGVDQPLGTLVKKEMVNHYGEQENEVILTIKVPGHTYQYGAFSDMRAYAPAQYQVYRVISEEQTSPHKIEMIVKELTTFPVRTPKGE